MTTTRFNVYDRGLLELSPSVWSALKAADAEGRLTARPKNYMDKDIAYEIWYENEGNVLVPRGLSRVPELQAVFGLAGYPEHSGALLPAKKYGTFSSNIQLKEFQKGPVEDVVTTLLETGGALLRADCGSGKTVMGLEIVHQLGDDISTVLVLVDQINLAEQWQERIAEFMPEVTSAIYGGNNENLDTVREDKAQIKIVVAQSLMRKQWINKPILADLLIVDEAHVFSAPCFCEAIANIGFVYSLALTATPDRKDGLQWIFSWILGDETIEVKNTNTLTPVVYQVHLDQPRFNTGDFRMSWCRRNGKMTWLDNCRQCLHFEKFPFTCGGYLPANRQTNHIQWGDKLNMTSLVQKVTNRDEYLMWLHETTIFLAEKGRKILVFSAFRDLLQSLHALGVQTLGDKAVGLYMGVRSKREEKLRAEALCKQVTYCTYGVANKGLDVPEKDTAIFATPRSDIRQAQGRIERPLTGKPQPIIVDPVHDYIPVLVGMAKKRERLYRQAGCTIIQK